MRHRQTPHRSTTRRHLHRLQCAESGTSASLHTGAVQHGAHELARVAGDKVELAVLRLVHAERRHHIEYKVRRLLQAV